MGTLGLLALASRTAWATNESTATPSLKPLKGFAMQLYTMREPAKKDLAGTLKKVREIGFKYVQWSGMPYDLCQPTLFVTAVENRPT